MLQPKLKIIGLTGGMAMGKSTASRYFCDHHIPVHDSDAAVHRLMQKGGSVYGKLEQLLPQVVNQESVNRAELSKYLRQYPAFLKTLEAIIHPEVRKDRDIFMRKQKLQSSKLVIWDVPLLFEVGLYRHCDGIIVVDCPIWLQRQRILKRKGMTPAKMKLLLSRQWSNERRKLYADYVVQTGLSFGNTHRQLRQILMYNRTP